MEYININIDGKDIKAAAGITILKAALDNSIHIPTLCHDDRVKPYGACGICVVESENSPKLLRACSTIISYGMIIKTNTEKVREVRKSALELMLSDHKGDCRPPCVTSCPADTDCQGYVGLIANGEYGEAIKLIKEKLPLPASIGRVCPHPCEKECRRKLAGEPVNIAGLKSFAADMDLNGQQYIPEIKESTGKTVAIIGGGPGGLSASYFLRKEGHEVHLYDAMEKMGGMLRYGIPEYRLPKSVLDSEIAVIEKMGVIMHESVRIGKDCSLDLLREKHDAVIVAIGAYKSMKLNCPGEELNSVLSGIDFLQDVTLGKYNKENASLNIGRRVAVVGGGNVAMDACRTAIRLGAEEVYVVYRRTKSEMPAEESEITEAEEEGVIFKLLCNPIEIMETDGSVSGMRLQKMELGAPDASGRRAPVPIPGAEEFIELDTVIIAIGQSTDNNGFEALSLTRRNTIAADENSFETNLPGVFAIGDAINKGAGIAVEAIGNARKAAAAADKYMRHGAVKSGNKSANENTCEEFSFLVSCVKTEKDFEDTPRPPRENMSHLSPTERINNFNEIASGYTVEQAKSEASRCLECGCEDYFRCKLIRFANEYDVNPEKYLDGGVHNRREDKSSSLIHRNLEKCILCGLCARACEEVTGCTALGYVNRGFDAVIMPEFGLPLEETDCVSCGMCAEICPTGAIYERLPILKPVPVKEEYKSSTCSFCSVGCDTQVAYKGGLLLRMLPDNTASATDKYSMLCSKGRFGFAAATERLKTPLINKDGEFFESGFEEASNLINRSLKGISDKYGKSSIAVSVSGKLTNEEIKLIKEYALKTLETDNIYSFGKVKSGIMDVFGQDSSTATFEDLEEAEVIFAICSDIMKSHTIAGMKIKKAVENGARLILISDKPNPADKWASIKITPDGSLNVLAQIVKALTDMREPEEANYDKLVNFIAEITVSDEVQAAAQELAMADKAVIIFDQNSLTADSARLIGYMSVLSGQGVIQLKPDCNSQALASLNIKDGDELRELISNNIIKGLITFGENINDEDLAMLKPEFLAVMDTIMSNAAKKAHVVLPLASPAETSGTYTNTVSIIKQVNQVICPLPGRTNIDAICKLAGFTGCEPEDAESVTDYEEEYIDNIQGKADNATDNTTLNIPEGDLMYRGRK